MVAGTISKLGSLIIYDETQDHTDHIIIFVGPDDALSPLRWMSTHLHRCRTTQGSLADSFLLLSQYSQPCTNSLSSVYERRTI